MKRAIDAPAGGDTALAPGYGRLGPVGMSRKFYQKKARIK